MLPSGQPTPPYVLAATAGSLTWSILNKHPIPGDAAAAAYIFAYPVLYITLQLYPSLTDHALLTTIALMATYTASALLTTAGYRLSPWHPLAKYPGPRHWRVSSLWLSWISSTGRRHLILDGLHAQYGAFVRIGPNTLSINSPAGQYIYSSAALMPKSDAYLAPGHDRRVAMFFKQPTEKLHTDRKRVWLGLFSKEGLSQLTPFVQRRAFQLLECVEQRQAESEDGTVDITECISQWAYDLMGDFVFGGCNRLEMMRTNDPRRIIQGGKLGTAFVDSAGQTPWLLDIIWRIPIRTAFHYLTETSAMSMETRLQVTEPPPIRDLVSFLAEDENIPEKDLYLEAIIAIQAGSDNTSVSLALAVYFITNEPKYFHLLRQELEQAFSDPYGPLPDDKLVRIPILDAILNEAMRLGTPYFMTRVVPEGGATIDEQFIPEGTVVALATYSQQVDPVNFYPEPLSFLPERWLPEGLGPDTRTNKSALASFSFGPHNCIGKQLAYQEMRHTLSRLVLSMDVHPVDDSDAKAFRGGITNRRSTMLKPLMVRVKRRGDRIPVDDI